MADYLPREIIARRAAAARAETGRFESSLMSDRAYAEALELHRKLSAEYLFGNSGNEEETASALREAESRLEAIRAAHGGPDICQRCGGTGYADGRVCDCALPEIYVKCFGAEDIGGFEESFEKTDHELFNGSDVIFSGKTQRDIYSIVEKRIADYASKVFGRGGGILIMGAPGLGKTFLCRSLAVRASEKRPVMYMTSPELARDFLSHRMGEPVELKYIWNAPLLIVDDLGTETVNSSVTSEYLCETIEKRAAGKLPTVFSTNLSIEDLQKMYGERISSRLQSPDYIPYMLFGDDVRLKRT